MSVSAVEIILSSFLFMISGTNMYSDLINNFSVSWGLVSSSSSMIVFFMYRAMA